MNDCSATTFARWAATCSGVPNSSASRRTRRRCTATLKQAGWIAARRQRGLGRRVRRCAERRAGVERDRVRGSALRARLLRRRHRGDRRHDARRAQRLPVAGGIPPPLPHARHRSLAHRRHPAGRAAGQPDLTFDDVVPAVRRKLGATLVFEACSWFSTYRIHHRRAAQFRARRCFLLGDAAHIHSPVGAQGMNTGLQDAYNLAWKLALVVSGRAAPALLDSYEEERIPVAERLLSTTDRGFSLIVSDSPLAGLFAPRCWPRSPPLAMHLRAGQAFAFMHHFADRHRVPPQPALEDAGGPSRLPLPTPATGFPGCGSISAPSGGVEDLFAALDDTHFTLLLFGEQAVPANPVARTRRPAARHQRPARPGNDRELARLHIPRPPSICSAPTATSRLRAQSPRSCATAKVFPSRPRSARTPPCPPAPAPR